MTGDQLKADDVCKRNPAPGTPPPAPVVLHGTFTCAGNAEVSGQFLSADGTERTFKLPTGDWNRCNALAASLGQTHATLTSTSVIAVCGGNAEVRRVAVTPTAITELTKITTGDWNVCNAKQTEINARPALGTDVQGTFICAGNAEVTALFVTPAGTEATISAPTGDWNRCRSLATKLAETRASITSTTLVAICGGNATVRRFSVTPAGEVHELSAIATGDWNVCYAQELQLNH